MLTPLLSGYTGSVSDQAKGDIDRQLVLNQVRVVATALEKNTSVTEIDLRCE